MYHFLYKTKNNVNGKIYIGIHSTNNLDDGYLGSGVALRSAVEKYGRENFSREILQYFYTRDALVAAESKLVNAELVSSSDNYNLSLGGNGGVFDEESKQKISEKNSGTLNGMYGKTHSAEAREKIAQASAARIRSPWSEESRRKASVSAKARTTPHPMIGRTRPVDQRRKQSYTKRSKNPLYLPENWAIAMRLRDEEGYTFAEIASYFNNKMGMMHVYDEMIRLEYRRIENERDVLRPMVSECR